VCSCVVFLQQVWSKITTLKRKVLHPNFLRSNFFFTVDPLVVIHQSKLTVKTASTHCQVLFKNFCSYFFYLYRPPRASNQLLHRQLFKSSKYRMTTLHTFGCSITQGFALPDVVKPLLNDQGQPLTDQEILALGDKFNWEDVHLYQPSDHAWPAVLAKKLNVPVVNHARRGACFHQIARQCAVAAADIKPEDTVIVMWTYLSRLSLQWPARTAVPFCNIVDPKWNLRTVILGFNKFFGLERSDKKVDYDDEYIQQYIHNATKYTHLDPMGIYDRYYNNLVLQVMTDGFLRATGARVIHLSVETESAKDQLEQARNQLVESLMTPYKIPHPDTWYSLAVDYNCCPIILDPGIPLAENDMHPSVQHHSNFADYVYNQYFH
jgi:hypothetical protein